MQHFEISLRENNKIFLKKKENNDLKLFRELIHIYKCKTTEKNKTS